MLNLNRRSKTFNRRAFVMIGVQSGLLLGLIGRLYHLQILQGAKYKTFSDSNRIKLLLLPPLRGRILDHRGEVLATNSNYYRILYDPTVTRNYEETLRKLAIILDMDEDGHARMLKKVKNHRGRNSFTLRGHLSWEDVAKVEVNAPDLPGVSIDVAQLRYFPIGALAAHLIGHLGAPTQNEIDQNPLLNHPDFKIGISGLEKIFEKHLRGQAGVRKMEVNAFGIAVRELSREESVSGNDLYLTLDKRLQIFTSARLQKQSGSIVLMDIHNGRVLCYIAAPGYDPNEFTYGISQRSWSRLMNDPDKPLINKPISSQYPPGSTFKMIVALAALGQGVNPEQSVYCPGHVDLGNHRFHCWKEEGHGHMTMQQAIAHSCNSYFYTISKRIGVEPIAAMAKRFGLGDKLDIILEDQQPGLVPTKEWKLQKMNVPWQTGDTLNMGIGQGFMLTTPIQLATMAARLATNQAVSPIFTSEERSSQQPFASINIPAEHLALIQKGMFHVVNTPGGTAYRSRIPEAPYSMAGKTGTVQVVSKTTLKNLGDLDAETKRRTNNHALFVGYGPVKNPRFAISVVIEHGGGGSSAAAPIAKDVMWEAQKLLLDPLEPKIQGDDNA